MNVVSFSLEDRMRFHDDAEKHVSRRSTAAAGCSLAKHADLGPIINTRRHVHVDAPVHHSNIYPDPLVSLVEVYDQLLLEVAACCRS